MGYFYLFYTPATTKNVSASASEVTTLWRYTNLFIIIIIIINVTEDGNYTVNQKTRHQTLSHNFANYYPIFKFFH